MIKILPDNIKIENPCDSCTMYTDYRAKYGNCCYDDSCENHLIYSHQQSILSQVVEVDIDAALKEFTPRSMHRRLEVENGIVKEITFSQFLQEKIKK